LFDLLGTGEPKPAALSGQYASRFLALAKEVDAPHLREYLSAIVGPRNRFTAQEKMTQVERYMHKTFEKHGWLVETQNYHHETFEHWSFERGARVKKQYQNLKGANVVATKLGEKLDQVVIIGAHYDTVDDSPGADDNGSGIAALLELARVLGRHNYSKTLVLVAFDMEEIGLVGSIDFVKRVSPKTKVDGAIIFETVGYIDESENSQKIPPGFSLLYRQQVGKVKRKQFKGDFITVIHNGKSRKLASLFAGANQLLNEAVPLVFIRDPLDLPILGPVLKLLFPALTNLLRSDHVPFWQTRIPAIQLTDTANFRNPHYHQPTDNIETVNLPVLQRLVQVVAMTVAALAEARRESN